jgi:uncharacterized membrane protein
MNRLAGYFLRGLLLIAPLAVTIYLLFFLLQSIDSLIPINIPGLGFLIILVSITLVGFVGSQLIFKPFFNRMERLLTKLPLVNIVYSSLKDLVSAFVGEQKKFNQPVLVTINEENCLRKLGFLTQKDLSQLKLTDEVAVYFPYAYAFSGDLFIVPAKNVTLLDVSATEVMKFIISGGVTKL